MSRTAWVAVGGSVENENPNVRHLFLFSVLNAVCLDFDPFTTTFVTLCVCVDGVCGACFFYISLKNVII